MIGYADPGQLLDAHRGGPGEAARPASLQAGGQGPGPVSSTDSQEYSCPILGLDGTCMRRRLSAGAYPGGQVARSSKKADRAAVSALLVVVIIVLVVLAVVAIRHGNWHTGAKYIAWAFLRWRYF